MKRPHISHCALKITEPDQSTFTSVCSLAGFRMWCTTTGASALGLLFLTCLYLLLASSGSDSTSTMPPKVKLHTLSATQVLALFKDDTITVLQYARALLSRLEERDDVVKAWAYLDKEHVLSQARALDRIPRSERGPLHGVGVCIKDIMDTKDMPTAWGSALYKDRRPAVDSSPVSILRSAGALIIGKGTTTEFTLPNFGPNTTNPHDRERTPGGSSAGPAAAVADYQVPLSFGTQNGGSIIRPASYTGIFAMKPTMHAISGDGVKIVSISTDTVGFFARSVEDLQLVANVFNLWADADSKTIPSLDQTRVAFVKSAMWQSAGPATVAAMENAARILKRHGVQVEEVELPPDLGDPKTIRATHKTILNIEAQAALLSDYRNNFKDQLGHKICDLVENKANVTHEQTIEAMDRYARWRPTFDNFAKDYAAIITPSAEDVAPLGLGDMGASTFNILWTGLYTPTINVPAFKGEEGMPVGLSILAGRFRDQYVLKIARILSKPLMDEGGWTIVEPPLANKL